MNEDYIGLVIRMKLAKISPVSNANRRSVRFFTRSISIFCLSEKIFHAIIMLVNENLNCYVRMNLNKAERMG